MRFRENTVKQVTDKNYLAYLMDEYARVSKWPDVTSRYRVNRVQANMMKAL